MNINNISKGTHLLWQYIQSAIYKKLGILGPLHKLSISITGKCNSRCLTCDIWKSDPTDDQRFNVDDFKKLCDSKMVRKAKTILLTGGEPFLNPEIEQIIKLLSIRTNAKLSIITNGLLTNRILSVAKKAKAEKWPIKKFSLSFNGDSETHDATRGIKGSFDRAVETIKGLKDLGFYVSLIFTITKENYSQLESTHKFAQKLEVDINFYPEITSYRFDNADNNRELSEEQKQQVKEQLANIVKKRQYYYFDDTTFYYLQQTFKGNKVCDCYSGLQSLYINWDGQVYPCEGFHDKNFSFGNIKKSSIEDIWNSPEANRIRKYIKSDGCQPCFLACEIIPSLRKKLLTMSLYSIKQRLFCKHHN